MKVTGEKVLFSGKEIPEIGKEISLALVVTDESLHRLGLLENLKRNWKWQKYLIRCMIKPLQIRR